MDLLPEDRIISAWFVDGENKNWMATLYERGGKICLEYRFRYYNPESKDPFDGKDRKSGYVGEFKGKSVDAVAAVQKLAESLAADFHSTAERVDINGDIHKFMEKLAGLPWAHFMRVEP